MISEARRIAFEVLCQISLRGAFSDNAVHSKLASDLALRDRRLMTELVYGTLRWQGLLDHALMQVSARAWDEVDPELRVLLRISLYQMWFTERVPDHAILDDAVELAKRRSTKSASGFVNAVLRTLSRWRPWADPETIRSWPPWVQVSLPKWLWERWSDRLGVDRARAYSLSLNQAPRCAVRAVPGSRGTIKGPCAIEASDLVPGAHFLAAGSSSRDLPPGFMVQDEASQLIPQLLGSTTSRHVWDTCAAPGGKSAILSEMCGESGWVVSSDLNRRRARQLSSALLSLSQRSGSMVLVADARRSPPFRTCFDAVLADVPCSGLGTLRRNPEIKWRVQPKQLARFQREQLAILRSVSESVRIGGLLLYSTCSTEPEENEQVVERFLGSHRQFRIRKPQFPPGIEAWLDGEGLLRTFIEARPWDGFFAALMARSR